MEDNQTPNLPQEVQAAEEMQAGLEIVEVQEEEISSTAPGKSKKWFIISGVLVIFLAAAVFLGARLLKSAAGADNNNGMGPSVGMLSSKGGGGGPARSVRINMDPAKELPQDQPSVAGIFVRREDQSIFIGTGNVRMMVKNSPDSSDPSNGVTSNYDGPVIEVVINHQTTIYQDITEMAPPESNSSGEVTVKQTVKPGSLDDLGANSMVTVWGDKQGDRFIARVITFR